MTVLPTLGLMSGGWFDARNPGKVPETARLDYDDPYYVLAKDPPPPVKEIYMDIPETLRSACIAKVQEALRPLDERSDVVEKTLGRYRAVALKEAERRVVATVLEALGQKAPEPDGDLETCEDGLRDALWGLLDLLPEEPAEAAPPPSPPSSPGKAAPEVDADPEALKSARTLLDEIDSEEFDEQHHLRLVPLLQAYTAEVRLLMSKLPETHPVHWQLSHTIRYIGKIRFEQDINDFIEGLARHHRADWGRVAREARAKVAKFDRDAEDATPKKSSPSKPKEGNGKPLPAVTHTWPALTALRAVLATGKDLLFVGGWKCQDKLVTVKERFGLEPDWYETDPGSPRCSENACNRIRGGKLAAVIVLEGFMTHKDWRRISDACMAACVPMVMANKAGVGSLEAALTEINRKLS